MFLCYYVSLRKFIINVHFSEISSFYCILLGNDFKIYILVKAVTYLIIGLPRNATICLPVFHFEMLV